MSLEQFQAEFELDPSGRAKRKAAPARVAPSYPTVDSLFAVPSLRNMNLQPEQVFQVEVATHLRLWRATKRLRGIYTAIPNELPIPSGMRRMAAMIGTKRKAMGGVPGASDFVFTWPDGGGWIELKAPGGDPFMGLVDGRLRHKKRRRGELREDQERFRDWCREEDVPWAVCRTLGEVERTLIEWGALEPAASA